MISVLLDVQSDLSLPEGGCRVQDLVSRAAACGVDGIALADRGTRCRGPELIRAAGAAGIRAAVGVRFDLVDLEGAELLVWPVDAGGDRQLDTWLRRGPELASFELPPAGGLAVLLQTHGVTPADLTPLRQLHDRLGDRLALAAPGRGTPDLAELGRRLGIPAVLAPSIRIVDVADVPLHRLLVRIRGDHGSRGGVRRPGRPERRPTGRQHSLEAAVLASWPAGAEQARLFFDRLALTGRIPAIAPGAPPETGTSWSAGKARRHLREHVQSRAAACGLLPDPTRLDQELDTLARRGALVPLAELADLIRRISHRMPVVPVGSSWSGSWIGWGLGLTFEPPVEGQLPVWLDNDEPFGEIHWQVPAGDEHTIRGALDLAGGRVPLRVAGVTAGETGRWLARDRGLGEPGARAMQNLIRGRRSGPRPRRGAGLSALAAQALALDGRPLALHTDRAVRVMTGGPRDGVPGTIDLLVSDAATLPGVRVRVTGDPGLAIVLGAAGGAWRAALERPVAGNGDHGGGRVDGRAVGTLVRGTLAVRGGGELGRRLRERGVKDLDGLARCLALASRPPDAPAPVFRLDTRADNPARIEILFAEDLVHFLRRAAGLDGTHARILMTATRAGRGAELARTRRRFVEGAEAHGHDPTVADRLFATLMVIARDLPERGPFLARAAVLAAVGELAVARPVDFLAAVLDQAVGRPERFEAARRWAAEHRITIEEVDLCRSRVATTPITGNAGSTPDTRRLRLGLLHRPGMTRVAAAILVAARGDAPVRSEADLVRRLRGRLPGAVLRKIATGAGEAESVVTGGGTAPAPGQRSGGAPSRGQTDLFATGRGGRPRLYSPTMARYAIVPVERAGSCATGSRIRVAGVIESVRGIVASNGRRFASAVLADGDHTAGLLITPSLLERLRELPLGRPMVITGRLKTAGESPELMVESAVPLEMLDRTMQPTLELVVPRGFRRTRALRNRLLGSPGRSLLRVRGGRGARVDRDLAPLGKLTVTPDAALLGDLKLMLGEDNVYLVGRGRRQSLETQPGGDPPLGGISLGQGAG